MKEACYDESGWNKIYECGPVDDGCGGTANCGDCGDGKMCAMNKCFQLGWNKMKLSDEGIKPFKLAHLVLDRNNMLFMLYGTTFYSTTSIPDDLNIGVWYGTKWDTWFVDVPDTIYVELMGYHYAQLLFSENNRPLMTLTVTQSNGYSDKLIRIYAGDEQNNNRKGSNWKFEEVASTPEDASGVIDLTKSCIDSNNFYHIFYFEKSSDGLTGAIRHIYFSKDADSNFVDYSMNEKYFDTDYVRDFDVLSEGSELLMCIIESESSSSKLYFVKNGDNKITIDTFGGGAYYPFNGKCKIVKNPETGNIEIFYSTDSALKVAIYDSGWNTYTIEDDASMFDGHGLDAIYDLDGNANVMFSAENEKMYLYKYSQGMWSVEEFSSMGLIPDIEKDPKGKKMYVLYKSFNDVWRFAWWFDGSYCVDNDGDFYGEGCLAFDCNDNDPGIHPGVIDFCDGIDNDCNGVADDIKDLDEDGYISAACGGTDCEDFYKDAYPSAEYDVCGDGIDQDCDGDNPSCSVTVVELDPGNVKVFPQKLWLPVEKQGACVKIFVNNESPYSLDISGLGFSGGGYVLPYSGGSFTACGLDSYLIISTGFSTHYVDLTWINSPKKVEF